MENYSQPFCVSTNPNAGSNPRFPYARNGYLPALEPPEEEPIEERVDELERILDCMQPLRQPPYKKLLELQGRLIHCENKIIEHLAVTSKRKPKIKPYKGVDIATDNHGKS